MNDWILSTEPSTFSWGRVQSEGMSRWDGVRGHRARNNMGRMLAGDRVWGYHSSPEKKVVCWARVTAPAYPDPLDARWLAVDVRFDSWLATPIPLAALKADPALSGMDFIRIPRLSIAPLTKRHVEIMERLASGG